MKWRRQWPKQRVKILVCNKCMEYRKAIGAMQTTNKHISYKLVHTIYYKTKLNKTTFSYTDGCDAFLKLQFLKCFGKHLTQLYFSSSWNGHTSPEIQMPESFLFL